MICWREDVLHGATLMACDIRPDDRARLVFNFNGIYGVDVLTTLETESRGCSKAP